MQYIHAFMGVLLMGEVLVTIPTMKNNNIVFGYGNVDNEFKTKKNEI